MTETVDRPVALPTISSDGAITGLTKLSVVICAYTERRWHDLLAAHRSVVEQLGGHDELIVVIDHNDRLFADAAATLQGCQVVRNAGTRGLSGARNTGVGTARGDVVVFLDDDAIARSSWLEFIRGTFRDESAQVVGTAVVPRWEGETAPRWFPEEFGWVVGCGYRGQPTTRAAVRNPIGASMAIRQSAFDAAGGFSDLVGRVGALPVGCEETEFCIRLTQRRPDAVVMHEPGAVVEHYVPTQRQRFRYFVQRCFHEGRSKRAVAKLCGSDAALSVERRYVRSVLPRAVARAGSPRQLRSDPAVLLRAGAVVVGLMATVAGYVAAAIASTDKVA